MSHSESSPLLSQDEVLARREKYLKVLGVTQYRRRELTVVHSSKIAGIAQTSDDSNSIQVTAQNAAFISDVPVQSEPALDKKKRSELFNGLSSEPSTPSLEVAHVNAASDTTSSVPIANQIDSVVAKIPKSSDVEENRTSQNTGVADQVNPHFDLLIWRANNLLVLDFSRSENELTAIKHRLTNNILRAIWPKEFSSCDMYQYSWPITGIAPDAESGREWFNSVVSGYTQQGENTPIWLMGEAGLDLLFYEQKQAVSESKADKSLYDDLIGTQTRHPKMDIDFLIGPSLSTLLESTVAKVQTWQLLKVLRRSGE